MSYLMIQLLCISGSMVFVVLSYALLYYFLKRRFTAGCFYKAGILVLVGFVVPFRPDLSKLIPRQSGIGGLVSGADMIRRAVTGRGNTFQESALIVNGMAGAHQDAAFSMILYIFVVWAAGAVAVLVYYGIRHARFMKTIKRWQYAVTEKTTLNIFDKVKQELGVSSDIAVKYCPCISSPMLIVIFHPVILLPVLCWTEKDLYFALRHELVHLKRKDLLYKGLLVLAAAINWFNPAVYAFARIFTEVCELSCDEAVTKGFDLNVRAYYAMAILRISHKETTQNTVFSTLFHGGDGNMKRRISSIMDISRKKSGIVLLAACFLLTIGSGSAFANSGSYEEVDYASADYSSYDYGIRTKEQTEKEIGEAFSEVFDREYYEDNFSGMVLGYEEDGIPVAADPEGILPQEGVIAAAGYEKSGFYSSSDCDSSGLVFYIQKGQEVEVTDSSAAMAAAKARYAGCTGYMKKSELEF